MIEVRDITKRYGNLTAIDRVTFRVEKGEVLAFLGPNGAGKTTTMRILTCFMPATEGSAHVAGFDCADQAEEVKKRIGYLPETPPVYQELTVCEYLSFVGKLRGLSGVGLTTAMDRVMERLSLGSVRRRLIANLFFAKLFRDSQSGQGTDQESDRLTLGHLEHTHSSRSDRRLPTRGHHQWWSNRRRRYPEPALGQITTLGKDQHHPEGPAAQRARTIP